MGRIQKTFAFEKVSKTLKQQFLARSVKALKQRRTFFYHDISKRRNRNDAKPDVLRPHGNAFVGTEDFFSQTENSVLNATEI